MKKQEGKMHLPILTIDDLFSTQQERDDLKLEKVVNVPLSEIDDFPNHPFKVVDDDELIKMSISIKENGMLVPTIVRLKEDGRYTQPVATIICFGLIAALIKIILSLGNITLLNTILTVIFTPLILFVLSFALAGMLLMFSFLSKGELSFEKSYKIVASQAFLYPIFILAFHLSFFWTMLVFVSMIADVYILLLAYISCVYGLKAKENLSQLVFGAVLILIVLFYLFTDSSTLWIGLRNPELAAQYLHSQFETLLETIKM